MLKRLLAAVVAVVMVGSIAIAFTSCSNNDKKIGEGEIDNKIISDGIENQFAQINSSAFDNSGFVILVSSTNERDYGEYTILSNDFTLYHQSIGFGPFDIRQSYTYEELKEGNTLREENYINIEEVGGEYLKMLNNAQNKIKKYVEQSTIISDKERVITEFDKLQFFLVDMDDKNDGAIFSPHNNTVWINKKCKIEIDEYVFLHELFHALQNITYPFQENMLFRGGWFYNEALTDMLALSLEPQVANKPAYDGVYIWADQFISVFKEEAIKAYFYGYSDILEIYSENELLLFMGLFNEYLHSPLKYNEDVKNSLLILLQKWHWKE